MSIQEERRAAFQFWAEQDDQAVGDDFRLTEGSDRYYWGATQTMWETWNAALDSARVVLPEPVAAQRHATSYQEGLSDGIERGLRHAFRAIETAGIKVEMSK
jgi:hypothetical protein